MKRRNKKAQGVFGMSFGAIFSILIIAFIIVVAFIAIRHFLGLNQCTQVGFFYDDLKKEVEKAWTSGEYGDFYNGSLPQSGLFGTKIEKVCFGRLDSTSATDEDKAVMQELENEYDFDPKGDYNVFLYPPEEACDEELAAITLKCRQGRSECATTEGKFFCINVVKGNVGVYLRKGDLDALVKIKKDWT
jgi:hypothetical protein